MATDGKRHGEECSRQAMPDQGHRDWSEGFGVGYSLLGESFTNFGSAGPLLQYLGLGIAWNLVWLGVVRRLITNDTLFMSLYAVYGYYLLIMMHRGPFSGIVTELAHTLPPLLLVHWFIDKAVIAGLSRPGIADGQGLKAR